MCRVLGALCYASACRVLRAVRYVTYATLRRDMCYMPCATLRHAVYHFLHISCLHDRVLLALYLVVLNKSASCFLLKNDRGITIISLEVPSIDINQNGSL